MEYKNYLIDYEVVNNRGQVIKSGTIRAKKKMSEFEAMAGLDNHLKKTVLDFYKMNVKKCRPETMFDDILGTGFGDDLFSELGLKNKK